MTSYPLRNKLANFQQWYLTALDIIESRIYIPDAPKVAKEPPLNICKIQFLHKGIDMIYIPRMLHHPSLTNAFPKTAGTYSAPTVVYNLEDTIRSTIFNFNKFVRSLDIHAFIMDESSLPCNCPNSPFKDPYHHHVVTGDL